MPTYEEDYLKIQSARDKQAKLNKESASLVAGSKTLKDRVMEKVRKARAERGTTALIQDRGQATGQIVSEPAAMRSRMSEVNPLAVDALTAKQSAQTLNTLATIGRLEEQEAGTIEDVIGAGTDRLVAAATMKKAEADEAEAEANSLIEMVRLKMDEEKMRLSQSGGGTLSYTLPNGQILSGLTSMQYNQLYTQYEGGGQAVELKSGQQDDMNFFKDIYKAADKAQVNQSDEYTGLWNYLQGNIRGARGTSDQAETSYRSAVDAHNTAIRNKISGTAVSKEEAKQLKNMLIKTTDSDNKVKQKINDAKSYALSGAGSILSTAGYDIDPMEYFQRDQQIKETETRPSLSSFDK